jgi:heme/copper-type cytochrome/quinol oxidase subunit 2
MNSRCTSIGLLAGLACISGAALWFAQVHSRAATAPALKIKAVAHQWWWEFDYPSLNIKTSNVLYLPSDNDVELELTSADVIHSFWIMGMKNSVKILPGRPRLLDVTVKSPGELHGNCDSGCGCASVCMRFRVVARTPAEFERWAAGARLTNAEFKPPSRSDTPACALGSGHDGHADNPAVNRLQKLLDTDSPPIHIAHAGIVKSARGKFNQSGRTSE